MTTVYVTHDQTEAMTLGQRVAVMRDGVIVQVAEPQVLYAAPRNLFVAAFIGSPAMNLVEAAIEGDEVSFGGIRVPLDAANRPVTRRRDASILGIRPEAFEDPGLAASTLPRLRVRVEVVEELGADTHVFFRVEAPQVSIDVQADGEEDATLLAGREHAVHGARRSPDAGCAGR